MTMMMWTLPRFLVKLDLGPAMAVSLPGLDLQASSGLQEPPPQ